MGRLVSATKPSPALLSTQSSAVFDYDFNDPMGICSFFHTDMHGVKVVIENVSDFVCTVCTKPGTA